MAGMPAMLALIVNRMSSPVWVRSVSPTAKASSLHKDSCKTGLFCCIEGLTDDLI